MRTSRKFRTLLLVVALGCSLLPAGAMAGFEEGVTAYKKGDFITAANEFKIAARNGDTAAMNNLGLLYVSGQGVARDYMEAATLFKMAADRGFAPAQTNLGVLYANGTGVSRDYREAARLFKLAGDNGDKTAYKKLGDLYMQGLLHK